MLNYLSKEELAKVKELSYANSEKEEIGFEHNGIWITNPFVDETGRFEFKDCDHMCKEYGLENVIGFIKEILKREERN